MATIVFMGSPEMAVPTLARLIKDGHVIAAVYTQPDKPSGRGRRLAVPPVKRWAEEHGLRVLQPSSLRGTEAARELRALGPEAMVVVAYGKLLSQAVLDIPPKGVLNMHPSLLPRYRGASPVASAVLSGDRETGVTIMLLDAGMDTGPILAQVREPVRPEDTTETLTARLARIGADLLAETLARWLNGEVTAQPQNAADATLCQRMAKEDGEIDWTEPADLIARRVRAYQPWPGTTTTWQGTALRILQARASLEYGQGASGTVVGLPEGIGIVTGEGTLVLERVQPEGKRPMTAREFVAGHRAFVGTRLEPRGP